VGRILLHLFQIGRSIIKSPDKLFILS
jgi:hypothetical protein